MARCTYSRNETLVHQQFSLHQLHHPHLSQRLTKPFFLLRDVTRSIHKIIATCIERATAMSGSSLEDKEATKLNSKAFYFR